MSTGYVVWRVSLILFHSSVETTVIEFEQSSYEVLEDIGLHNFALRVCINIFNLTSERIVRLSTISGTAQGNHCMYAVSVYVGV